MISWAKSGKSVINSWKASKHFILASSLSKLQFFYHSKKISSSESYTGCHGGPDDNCICNSLSPCGIAEGPCTLDTDCKGHFKCNGIQPIGSNYLEPKK